MRISRKKIRLLVNAFLCLVLIAALFSHPITSYAASGITSSDLRFGLQKGKEVTFKSYVSGVGLRDIKVKLSKYSVKNETIKVDGKKIKTKRIKAIFKFTAPDLSAKDTEKHLNTDEGIFNECIVITINTKNGKYAPIKKNRKYEWIDSNPVERYGFSYYQRFSLTHDINVLASDNVAIGVIGYSKKSYTNKGISKAKQFYDGKLSFKKTYNYDKNNKMLSIWKKVN